MSFVSLWSTVIAPPFLCWAASYQVKSYGLNTFRRPLVPLFAGVLNVAQFSVEPLKGLHVAQHRNVQTAESTITYLLLSGW